MGSRRAKLLARLAFLPMEALSPAPGGASASRSRASNGKSLPVRLSGGGMEKLIRQAPALQREAKMPWIGTNPAERVKPPCLAWKVGTVSASGGGR